MPSNDLKRVIKYLRRATTQELDKRTLLGVEVPSDPAARRKVRYWVHGADMRRDGDGPTPVVVELHGGGFALGDARKGDAVRDWISRRYEAHVLGVDYRLAPENPAPCALEDVVEAARFASARFADGAGTPATVYFVGYSAGADLALAAALELQGFSDVSLGGLALHYPLVDASEEQPDDGGDEGLPGELMAAFSSWYAAGRDLRDPKISPALASDEKLQRLPMVALYPVLGDPLFGQAEHLRDRLLSLGCSVSWNPVADMFHGYIEDAEDLELYRATTLPQTMKTRPDDFVQVAACKLDESLAELLGPARHDVTFPSLEKGDDSI